MAITLFSSITNKEKEEAVLKFITHSTPRQEFYLMVALAIAMATFGLLLDNSAIIIGSMLISPILYAFLSLALGLSISDPNLMWRSLQTILKAIFWGLGISAVITLFADTDVVNHATLGGFRPSLLYGAVALIAGFAAAFTATRPQLNETLPGVAIAVALIPPIGASGIGLATLNWALFRGAFTLFLLNTLAIVGGSLVVFLLMNTYAKKRVVEETLRSEEKKIEAESE